MQSSTNRPAATLSVDVDPIDCHLAGHGLPGLPPDAVVYERAVPRLLEVFAAHRVRATWFFVGRDADRARGAIEQVVAAGHEVASHSQHHPVGFHRLSPDEVASELGRSRSALEEASGTSVRGFRAPGWERPGQLEEALVTAGYAYDASYYPSPLVAAAGLLLSLRRGGRPFLGSGQWLGAREPRQLQAGLREFPVSVTRIRLPIYHTMRYQLSDSRFESILDRLAAEGHELSYPIHAVDALSLLEDPIDPRMKRHPGMRFEGAHKLALLDRSLAAIATRFDASPFVERLA
jgi:hypothetical protein